MVRLLPIGALLFAASAALAQSPPMDDLLWVAANPVTLAVDRYGRTVHQLAVPVVSVHRAPDGTVWTLGPSGDLQRRDRLGSQLQAANTGGANRAMTFDARGDAWVAVDRPPTLLRYSPTAALRQNIPLLAPPQDVEVDARGMVWVIQTTQPSSLVMVVDPRTGSSSTFTLPPTFGFASCIETTPYGTALIGSGSIGRMIEIDANQVIRRTVDFGVQRIIRIALRAQGDALIAGREDGLHSFDLATRMTTRLSIDEAWDIGLDALGGIWTSDSQQIARFDPDRRRFVVRIPIANAALPQIHGGTGYQRALVVAPNADDDGDGLSNAAELQFGTNPYDAQSSPTASLHTAGLIRRQYDRLSFELRGTGGQGVLFMATRTLGGQPPIPGFAGELRLDPGATLPVAFASVVPGAVQLVVPDDPALAGALLFAQAVTGAFPPTLTNEAGVRIEQTGTSIITETFQNEAGLDRERSAGSWSRGVAAPGPIGGSGALGDFDHRLGQQVGPDHWLWSTDDITIPGTHTLSGQPIRVTDGRFEFTKLSVPAGVTVRFAGSNPATIRVSGDCRIDGVLDLDGEVVPGDHDGRNATFVGTTVVPGPGKDGGAPGAGGGRGGDGAWSCDGTGNPNQPQFHGFAGYDGEDLQVATGHAYAAATVGTGGRGGSLFPGHGDQTLLVYRGFGNPGTFAVEAAAGGGGGGFRAAGAPGTCAFAGAIQGSLPFPNTNSAERGPSSPGGLAFALLPPPAATSSLEHFLVGGSGGGGGGSHPLFALRTGTADLAKYRSGSAGAGGGGAVALRVGHDLHVAATAEIRARGGSAEPTATTFSVSQRGVPAPGGGGSGGSVLLQVGGLVSQRGTLDVRGGTGSAVRLASFWSCDTRGGDGAPGSMRLEVAGSNPPLLLIGTTLPPATSSDVGTLRDRDGIVAQLSREITIASISNATELLHYELDVAVGGVTQTYTDDPAAFRPANQPGQPVRIRFQAYDATTATRGMWRDLVTNAIPGVAGIAGDRPTHYRFQLIFDSSITTAAVVEEVRVLAR